MNADAPDRLTDPRRLESLLAYLRDLPKPGIDRKALYLRHQAALSSVTPQEVLEAFNQQLEAGQNPESVLLYLDQAIHVMSNSLRAGYREPDPATQPLLALFEAENKALEDDLNQIRLQLLQFLPSQSAYDRLVILRPLIAPLLNAGLHYQKKENILFPMLEKQHPSFAGLKIMWSLHDRARQLLKMTQTDFSKDALPLEQQKARLGQLFFMLQGLIHKERWLLYPVARQWLDTATQRHLLAQCKDYPPAWLSSAEYEAFLNSFAQLAVPCQEELNLAAESTLSSAFILTETGQLNAEQALAVFSALPVDLSFVDADNKLRFFNRPKERIFPRSPAAIGRDVALCHPPSSVHIVEQIIAAMRSGSRDKARFFITFKDRKILIEYFAVRDEKHTYLGVLEVSQDITDVLALSGEQRLLDWN